MRTFDDLAGKTISSVLDKRPKNSDDQRFIRMTFTDGTHCIIRCGYSRYAGYGSRMIKNWMLLTCFCISVIASCAMAVLGNHDASTAMAIIAFCVVVLPFLWE